MRICLVSTVKSVPADQRSLFKEFWETWADNIERRAFRMQITPLLRWPFKKNRDQRSGILHFVRDP